MGGLHLPEAGLPLDEVRRRHPNLRIGRSAHSARSAVETARLGADWVILGPAFPTGAKRTPLPAGELERAARESEAPVWAIGGIAPENVAGVLDSGVAGVAAIRSMGSPEAVRELRERRVANGADGPIVTVTMRGVADMARRAAALAILLGAASGAAAQPDSDLERAARSRLASGDQFLSGGRHEQALRDFEAVLETMTESSLADDAALRIARWRLEVGEDPAGAGAMVERILTQFPAGDATPGAYLLRARIAREAIPPRFDDAQADWERVAALGVGVGSSGSRDALLELARHSFAFMRDDEAAGALLEALYGNEAGGDPAERLEARFLLGQALARSGDRAAALDALVALRADLPPESELGDRALEIRDPHPGRGGGSRVDARRRGAGAAPARPSAPVAGVRPRAPRPRPGHRRAPELHARRNHDRGRPGGRRAELRPAVRRQAGDRRRASARRDGQPVRLLVPDEAGRLRALDRIRSVAVTPEGLWVWDERRERAFRFTHSLVFVDVGPAELSDIRLIERHPSGHLLVLGEEGGLRGLDAAGNSVARLPVAEPLDVAFDALGRMFVLDGQGPLVAVYDREFRLTESIPASELGRAGLRDPVSLDVGSDGTVFVLGERGAIGAFR